MRFDLAADASINAVQQGLLRDLGLSAEYAFESNKLPASILSDFLTRARIACIDGMEAYFGRLEPTRCIGARNEGAAISLLQQKARLLTGGLHIPSQTFVLQVSNVFSHTCMAMEGLQTQACCCR